MHAPAEPTGVKTRRSAVLIRGACAVFLMLAGLGAPAHAERPPEPRSSAAYVVEGVVTSVKTTHSGLFERYLVVLRVAKVLKGAGLKEGSELRVTSFQLVDTPPQGWVGPTGHGKPPQDGARITAYVSARPDQGGYEGIYKSWFDLLPAAGPAR